MERAGRGGKTVTIVSGFIGTTADLQTLCKLLKQNAVLEERPKITRLLCKATCVLN